MLNCDVAIIGAGPTGSATASFLAMAGLSVVVIEKDHFPRFHIGESLLPLGIPVLEMLGIDLDQAPYALRKAGAQVIHEPSNQWYHIDFTKTLPGCITYAYQVERAAFDHHLANRAQELGAVIRFGTRCLSTKEEQSAVTLFTDKGELHARYALDATGIDCLGARQNRSLDRIRGMGKCATFSQFGGVTNSLARDTFAKGDILLFLKERGWSWAIPIAGNRLSVGTIHVEGQSIPPAELAFKELIEQSPLLTRLLEGATRLEPIRRCADFSYYNRAAATRRQATVGDARAFLDPVFSSGVSLGLHTGWKLAQELVRIAAVDGRLDEELSAYYQESELGYQALERIIERFYRPGWAQTTFFSHDANDLMVRQLNTMLAGDLWRNDNDWQRQLLASRRRTIRIESDLRNAAS